MTTVYLCSGGYFQQDNAPSHKAQIISDKISEECFQHLVESMPRIIKAVLKEKGGPTRYQQGVTNKVASECIHILTNIIYWCLLKMWYYLIMRYYFSDSIYYLWSVCMCDSRKCNFELQSELLISKHRAVLIQRKRLSSSKHIHYPHKHVSKKQTCNIL